MRVDRLVILYEEERNPEGESPTTARNLKARHDEARALATNDEAIAKLQGKVVRSFLIGFSGLDEKNAEGIRNAVAK
ncbi:hypothetical protein [Paraburkholderia sp.]|uniref:hypothetical protein n=1 Tax=Paraburkholderia sp. TaxID=1926495 RepID=UPI0025F4E7D6|nr:hypothetical protein [Paraburkholderia sp.]